MSLMEMNYDKCVSDSLAASVVIISWSSARKRHTFYAVRFLGIFATLRLQIYVEMIA